MSDQREQKRDTLARATGIAGWVLFVATAVFAFSMRHLSPKQQVRLESLNEGLEIALIDRDAQLAEQSRLLQQANKKNEQLASEMATIGKHDSRDGLRLPRRTEQEGRRFIGRDGVARLRAMLQDAPAFDVEIGCMHGDTDSLAISEELRAAFEAAGSKVRELVRLASPPIKLRGVSIHSKPKFDDVLGNIIGQIFHEVSQEKNQWVSSDALDAFKPDAPEADIRIFVGTK